MARKPRTTNQEVLVLKSKSLGEMDRSVTLVSRERGRFLAVAKGVRRLASAQKSALETGSVAKAMLIETHAGASWPLVTQATLIADCQLARGNLVKIRQLMQFLEILDKLLVEEELEEEIWQEILLIRQLIVGVAETDPQRNGLVKQKMGNLVRNLGFQNPEAEKYSSLLDYVADLTGQPMHSWQYLDPSIGRQRQKR